MLACCAHSRLFDRTVKMQRSTIMMSFYVGSGSAERVRARLTSSRAARCLGDLNGVLGSDCGFTRIFAQSTRSWS
jgi:hypothetical protein